MNIPFLHKNRHIKIIINDQRIDKDIAIIILKIEETISDLNIALEKNQYLQKDEDTRKLFSLFSDLSKKISILIDDLDLLRLVKLREKNYLEIEDESYLIDKLEQLETMKTELASLIEITIQAPSDADYERQTFNEIIKHLNSFIEALNRIKKDDDYLLKAYHSIKNKK